MKYSSRFNLNSIINKLARKSSVMSINELKSADGPETQWADLFQSCKDLQAKNSDGTNKPAGFPLPPRPQCAAPELDRQLSTFIWSPLPPMECF